MNNILQEYSRNYLLENLAKLPDSWQRLFKLMYGTDNGKRSVEEVEIMDMSDVIAEIPSEKLDWAMTQVDNSLKKQKLTDKGEVVK